VRDPYTAFKAPHLWFSYALKVRSPVSGGRQRLELGQLTGVWAHRMDPAIGAVPIEDCVWGERKASRLSFRAREDGEVQFQRLKPKFEPCLQEKARWHPRSSQSLLFMTAPVAPSKVWLVGLSGPQYRLEPA